jgi:histidinol-phosphatase (PHP family)
MLANYHTHTSRCHHASGTDEEYIQKAIAENIKILGFSDHAPYLYPNGYVSYYKMLPTDIPEYMSSLRALREKYRDKIEIIIGYEAEYYPDLWDKTFEFWRESPPEYLILGQHFFSDEYVPKDKLLNGNTATADTSSANNFKEIPDDDLPF